MQVECRWLVRRWLTNHGWKSPRCYGNVVKLWKSVVESRVWCWGLRSKTERLCACEFNTMHFTFGQVLPSKGEVLPTTGDDLQQGRQDFCTLAFTNCVFLKTWGTSENVEYVLRAILFLFFYLWKTPRIDGWQSSPEHHLFETNLRRYRNLHPTFSKVPALPSLFVYARTYSILKTAANPQDTRNGLCVVVPSALVLPFYESYCPCSWVGYQGAPTSSHSPNRDSDTSRR